MNDRYVYLGEPKKVLSRGGKVNAELGAALAGEMRACASSLESDFSQVYVQMDTYERWWRADRDSTWDLDESERRLKEFLPRSPSAEGRNLCDALMRSVTKKALEWRSPIGNDWTAEQREAAAALETYAYGALAMVDAERRRAGFRPVQWTAAWQLIVRGMGIVVAQVRSGPGQKYPDAAGDRQPFMWRTPDPRECGFATDGDGISAFAHHYWRDRFSLRGRDDLQAAYENPSRDKEGLCDTVNLWWRADDGDIWNAVIVENEFSVPPTNHTARRKLSYVPVFVDTAYGAPPETRLSGDDLTSLRFHFQGALENNIESYRLSARIRAYQMALLRDSALYGLVMFTNKNVTKADVDKMFQGRSVTVLDKEDRPPQLLQPPQLSASVAELAAELNLQKQQGGLPGAAAGNVPAGVSGILASMMAQQGDLKAGPVSDALKRMMLAAMECTVEQHRALRRSIQMRGRYGTTNFIRKFDGDKLPDPASVILEAVHDAVLVKDEYAEANTIATLRNAGLPRLTMFDRIERDPLEQERRFFEELMKQDPMVQALEMAAIAARLGRDDIAALFSQRAQMMNAPQGAPAGASPAPVQGVDPEAGVMPQLGGARVDPSQATTQQRLGALGLEYGGR